MTTTMPAAYEPPLDATPGPIYIDTQHEDMVHDAQMDYYGAKLATCSSGTCAYIASTCEFPGRATLEALAY
jgi:hypothetical protein